MNGREWHWITLGGHVAAQTGLARPIGFALFPTYAEDEWFQHRFIHGIGVADFCGFRGAAESRFSAYCRFLADRSNERPVGRLTIHAKLCDRHAISSIIALPHAGVASVRVATELEGPLRMGIGEAMLFTSFWFG
jgi:hypothetical protein